MSTHTHTPSYQHSEDAELVVSWFPGVTVATSHERHDFSCDTFDQSNHDSADRGDGADSESVEPHGVVDADAVAVSRM